MCKSYGGRPRDYVRVVLAVGWILAGLASCERRPAPVTHQDGVASASSAAVRARAELSPRPSQEPTIRPCSTTKAFFAGTAIAGREDWYAGHLVALGERRQLAEWLLAKSALVPAKLVRAY